MGLTFSKSTKLKPVPDYVMDTILQIDRYNIMSKESSSIFGVFVTIERKNRDIHGCIGSWDDSFNSYNNIKNRLIDAAESASRKDERRLKFSSLLSDLQSIVRVSYMVLPVRKIDNDGYIEKSNNFSLLLDSQREKFDNNKYGIIVNSDSGKKATYLPGVFSNIDYKDIKQSLIEKARLKLGEKPSFYAYETITERSKLYNYLVNPLCKWLNDNYKSFVPYSVNKRGNILIDKNQDIRNIATMYDILCLIRTDLNNINWRNHDLDIYDSISDLIQENLEYYNNKIRKLSLQALSFLLLCNNLFEDNEATTKKIETILVDGLESKLEPDFELGQILYSLIKTNTKKYGDIVKKQLEKVELKNNVNIDSIFGLNWLSKTVFSSKIRDTRLMNRIKKKFLKWYSKFYSKNLETNYLAVTYETLSTIYRDIGVEKRDIILETVFHDLHKRRLHYSGLFAFQDGSCRLDITGHVLNGYFNFIK